MYYLTYAFDCTTHAFDRVPLMKSPTFETAIHAHRKLVTGLQVAKEAISGGAQSPSPSPSP